MHIFLCVLCTLGTEPIDEVYCEARGLWLLDEKHHTVPPELWRRGLQTSGLTFHEGLLISVGDQRSNVAGHLFCFSPPERTSRTNTKRELAFLQAPVPIVPAAGLSGKVLERFLRKKNPDFEGIAADPYRPGAFYAVVEMDGPYLLQLTWKRGQKKAFIERICEVELPGIEPWRFDTNYRFEGIEVLGPDGTLLVAFERAEDLLPRLLSVSWPQQAGSDHVKARVLPVPFGKIPDRAGKGLLNLNGLAAVRSQGVVPQRGQCIAPGFLLGCARDQERIVVIETGSWRCVRVVSVQFRGPEGEKLMWTSPEGIACDSTSGSVYLISDPDSIRGNFRRLADPQPTGRYADMVPLLFRLNLNQILPRKR